MRIGVVVPLTQIDDDTTLQAMHTDSCCTGREPSLYRFRVCSLDSAPGNGRLRFDQTGLVVSDLRIDRHRRYAMPFGAHETHLVET